jgi:endonuclease YncB( thermonuclease family)
MRFFYPLLLVATSATAQTVLTGPVRVVDADTLDLGLAETVRLLAIDAPEAGQTCLDGAAVLPCGEMATEAARKLFEGREAACTVMDRDRYGRHLATCSVDGADVGETLVAGGWALLYRDDPTYAEAEKAARVTGAGVWAYEMLDPAAWRAALAAEHASDNAPGPGDCPIKGNVSDSGRIYHVPGSRAYGPTRIDPERGERWFCSEAEARAAGWRRARR